VALEDSPSVGVGLGEEDVVVSGSVEAEVHASDAGEK
jgi:hypothetical protein